MSDKACGTVLITTRNRRDDLRNAIVSCLEQSVPLEILVIDDGSTDGTADAVRSEFPGVALHRFERSEGLVVQRNRGIPMAESSIVFSLDDDAVFVSPTTVESTLADFNHPRVGAIAIPYVAVRRGPKVEQRAPDERETWVTWGFIGAAHALRREVFVELGGYRPQIFQQGEEKDFCVRMLNAGFVTRLGRWGLVHHFESPRRDFGRMEQYRSRNDILYVWHNVPMPYTAPHMLATSVKAVRRAIVSDRRTPALKGIALGYGASAREFRNRAPVRQATYRLFRHLSIRGPLPLREVERRLAPIR